MASVAKPTIGKPIPAVTPEMAGFFEGARRGQLMVERCDHCGTLRFPAHDMCASCLAAGAKWVPVSGRGEIYSFNIMHQVYHPAFATEVPYAVVVVKLEEGPKFISNLIGIKPHEIKIGMPVEVTFERAGEEMMIPKFRPRARV